MSNYDRLRTIEDGKNYTLWIRFIDFDGYGNTLKCGLKLGEDIKRLFYFFCDNVGRVFKNVDIGLGIKKNSYILYLYFVKNY